MQSKLLRLNSRYRTSSSKSNTDFTISIGTQDLENISRCTLLGVKIPRMFGNLYVGVNVLHATVTEFPEQPMPWDIVFPPGVYTSESLTIELNRQMKLAYEWITVTWDLTRERMKFVCADSGRPTQITIVIQTTEAAQLCGITQSITLESLRATQYAASTTALSGLSCVYLESTFIANKACLDVLQNGMSIPLFAVVPCATVPEGFDICWQPSNQDMWAVDYTVENTGLISLRQIDVKLTDVFGNILTLPENQPVDLVFRVYK